MLNTAKKQYLIALGNKYKFCMQCAAPLIVRQIDCEWRLACTDAHCDFVHWNNPVPVVAGLVEHVERLEDSGAFVLAHNILWPLGVYSLITGFLEDEDQSPALAIKREVQEELGLHALSYHFIGHYMSSRANQLILAFHVKAFGEIKLNHELDDYKRIEYTKLKGWNTETGRAVSDYLMQRQNNALEHVAYVNIV